MRAVTEVLGPHPGGLGLPAAEVSSEYAAHTPPLPDDLPALLAEAPVAARAILDTLTWGPPIGAVPPSGPAHQGASWLVTHGLCAPSGIGHITLVREVGLALRGGRLHREPALQAPALTDAQVDPAVADRVAGAGARDLLGLLDQLGDLWTALPPRVLRSGALGVRDLPGLARSLDVETAQAGWLAEVALAAWVENTRFNKMKLGGSNRQGPGARLFQVSQVMTTPVWMTRNLAVPMVWAMRSLKRPKPSGS